MRLNFLSDNKHWLLRYNLSCFYPVIEFAFLELCQKSKVNKTLQIFKEIRRITQTHCISFIYF